MTTVTSGAITATKVTLNNQQASLTASFASNAYSGYNQSAIPVFNPAGYVSIPMPNRMALCHLTPNGTTGYIAGFANEMPNPENEINNVSDLVQGESAITETATFNFNIKAKLDKLMSSFTNSSDTKIDTTITIGENVVNALKDLLNELQLFENAYNSFVNTYNGHQHNVVGVKGGGETIQSAATTSTGSAYSPSSNFTRDKNFINQSPSRMFINLNGEVIS